MSEGAFQGLHLRHVRLDLVRAHRRHHRCFWTTHSGHRVRSRQYQWAGIDPQRLGADRYVETVSAPSENL